MDKQTRWNPPPEIEAKLYELFELGKDGNERLIIMRGDKEILRRRGGEDGVRMPDGVAEPGDVFLHNHPNTLNSFSDADLVIGAREKGDCYVITGDRSMYFARSKVGSNEMTLATMIVDIRIGREAQKAIDMFNKGRTVEMGRAHMLNNLLMQMGLIDYRFRVEQPTREAIDFVRNWSEKELAKLTQAKGGKQAP